MARQSRAGSRQRRARRVFCAGSAPYAHRRGHPAWRRTTRAAGAAARGTSLGCDRRPRLREPGRHPRSRGTGLGAPADPAAGIGARRGQNRRGAGADPARNPGAAMIVPATRLLWLAALVCLPAAAVAGLFPSLAARGGLTVVLCAAVALLDAVGGARRIDMLEVRTPASMRLTKDVSARIPLAIENRKRRAAALRIAVRMPEGI